MADQARSARRWRIVLSLVVLCVAVGSALRARRRALRDTARSLLWITGVFAGTALVWVVLRGSFDYTSINDRESFLWASVSICTGVAFIGAWLHVRVFHDLAGGARIRRRDTGPVGLARARVRVRLAAGLPVPHRVVFFPVLRGDVRVVHGVLGIVARCSLHAGLEVVDLDGRAIGVLRTFALTSAREPRTRRAARAS